MTTLLTVAPSPSRTRPLVMGESVYLIELATRIADEEPEWRVVAKYGLGDEDVMFVSTASHDGELF
ncbi:hypothetical protein [Magnetospirillum molischianum]|uniref:Uncharacterized protein n=1 Tax=Magnetospirillum molischianum DSM 120 TaxID=1150626 RepID=H8FPX7_MAGML|nr:hypothetical protein [Magnetospirillum molischianum]CCG40415.1 hypothetical protein PHAMO_20101 [Magnetospirillum molischianum DSM 120]